jgi:Zn finger protein HypA/HybF involved in hydrogenase expression
MHEYSIVQALYDSVIAQTAARGAVAVHSLHVRIGELSGVDAGLLDTAWRTFRVHTIARRPRWRSTGPGPLGCRGGAGVRARAPAVPACAVGSRRGRRNPLDRIVMEVP